MKKKILLLTLAAALFSVMPSIAQNESYVTLSGNAYITAGPEKGAAFIDENNCTLRGWNDAASVVSFYFRTETAGKMTVALQAKGHSQIEATLLGKTKKIKLDSDTLVRVEVGTFDVKTPGYVKMDIRGVKIKKGDDFGNVR